MTTKSLHRPNSTWTFTHYCHRLNLSWWPGTDVKGSLILSFFMQCWKYFHRIFFESYRPRLYHWKTDQGDQRSVFWQCPSKSHSFLSTFDITVLQLIWGIILRYRSWRKTVSAHVSALISRPVWEEENATDTSGAIVIVVWVIKSQRKRRRIFHPTEMHAEVAGRASFFPCSYLRSPRSLWNAPVTSQADPWAQSI